MTPADAFEVAVDGERADELAAAGGESTSPARRRGFAEASRSRRLPPRPRPGRQADPGRGRDGRRERRRRGALLRVLGARDGTEPERLAAIGASVGADVPALLAGGPVFAEGRGERVAPVHGTTTHWVVKPFGLTVRAADAYGWWDEAPVHRPDPGALVGAFETGASTCWPTPPRTTSRRAVAARHPAVGHAAAVFREAGALTALMTGSGPTVVALAADPATPIAWPRRCAARSSTSGPPRTMTR